MGEELDESGALYRLRLPPRADTGAEELTPMAARRIFAEKEDAMRLIPFAFLAVSALSGPADAQTTNCQWFGAVWTCNQQPTPSRSSGIQWDRLQPSNSSFNDSLRTGMELGEQMRRAQQEHERSKAEADLYRAQAEAIRAQTQQQQTGSVPQAPAQPDYLAAWQRAAQPRMYLFPDYEKTVFAPEVNITLDMVKLMTSSPYAADIAYYLATHRAESTAIAQLPLLDAARAIDRIESEVKSQVPPGIKQGD